MENLYQLYLNHPAVTTDSRNCPPGSIFIALKGDNFNGNAFVGKALEAGCSYAITDEPEYATDPRIILVDDCLKTLQHLANHHRKQFKGKVIGITGTNGKTTTKELTSAVLSRKYKTIYTLGNLNNHIGVPLTLLRLNDACEIAVIEMGANHPGEIKALCEIAEPDYGLITNVGKAHLEGFGSFEGVIHTKGELYDFLRQKKGMIFINHENGYLQDIAGEIDRKEYGKTPGLYVSGKITDSSPFLSFEWSAEGGETFLSETKLVGEYNLENALAAIAIGTFFGIDGISVNEAIKEYAPQNNRSQLKKTDRNSLIIDAYNANPTSMAASVSNFAKMNIPKKALILGDMLELGELSEEEHQKIVDLLNDAGFEHVFLIGELFAKTTNRYRSFHSVHDFISEIPKLDLNDYTILIKGSRGLKLELTIDHL